MTNNSFQQVPQHQQEDEVDLKRLFFLLLRHWYWLAICMVLGVAGGWFWGQTKHQAYSIDTSIIVPDKSNGFDLENIFEKSVSGSSSQSINNEIELLKSFTLNHRVVENLNWRTAWYEKDFFRWKGLYTREPFLVQELETGNNAENVAITIHPLENGKYDISVDGDGIVNNERVDINFSATGTFGQPFENQFFHFVLHKKDDKQPVDGKSYRFFFQNANGQTFSHLKRINVSQTDKNGEVIRISIDGVEPLREIHYLNELVREYMGLKLEQQTETQKRSLEFIDKQLSGISDSLSAAGTNFSEFRSKNQLLDVSAQGNIVMEQLSDIEKERSQQQIQLDYFRNLLVYLDKNENIKQLVSPSVVGIEDPGLNSLVLKLSELYSRREVISFSARENTPTLILLNNEINQANKLLRENLVNLIDNAQQAIKSLERRYQNISSQLNNLPGKEQQLINIQRQFELTNEIYTFMLQKRAEIEISLASTVVDIQVIDPARMERILPTGMSLTVLLALGALLGLALPALIILLGDMFNSKIHMQEDVEKLTPLTIIGNVLHSRHASELVVYEYPTAPISESYRTIRTNLQYKFTKTSEKVIGIHSIVPGEGKSFSATNLSSILAMNNKKVLLIGCDLRKPRLHQIFGVANETGLSNYLVGHSSMEEIVIETTIDNLFLVPSGPVPPNPAELLERERFNELMEWAKKNFDYIILDNAPVSMVTDGLITSRVCDLNIFILRYGVSRKSQLKFTNELAHKGVMKNPALVINDIKLDGFGYGYGYGNSYKYAYGKGYYMAGEKSKKKEKGLFWWN